MQSEVFFTQFIKTAFRSHKFLCLAVKVNFPVFKVHETMNAPVHDLEIRATMFFTRRRLALLPFGARTSGRYLGSVDRPTAKGRKIASGVRFPGSRGWRTLHGTALLFYQHFFDQLPYIGIRGQARVRFQGRPPCAAPSCLAGSWENPDGDTSPAFPRAWASTPLAW